MESPRCGRARWILLIAQLSLFVLILILPQVALPAFTVQGRSAPVVAHLTHSAPPVAHAGILRLELPHAMDRRVASSVAEGRSAHYDLNSASLLTLLCTLLC